MRTTRTIAAASMTGLLLLGGCGGGDSSASSSTTGPPATTVPATSSTTKPAAGLKAALLTAADVPGSTETPAAGGDSDISACFPGNPFAVKTDPNEVNGPDLELAEGDVRRTYASSARQATPEQATAFIKTFASASGSACVLAAFKANIGADPTPPKVDASGLTGTASSIPVADGGVLLAIRGGLVVNSTTFPSGFDVVAFQKGPLVVLMSVTAIRGAVVANQAVELAQKIAGRLS